MITFKSSLILRRFEVGFYLRVHGLSRVIILRLDPGQQRLRLILPVPFLELPTIFYNAEVLRTIATSVGKPVKVDASTQLAVRER